MCGIFAVLSSHSKDNIDFERQNFHKGKNRGPESSVFKKISDNAIRKWYPEIPKEWKKLKNQI